MTGEGALFGRIMPMSMSAAKSRLDGGCKGLSSLSFLWGWQKMLMKRRYFWYKKLTWIEAYSKPA